MASSPLRQHKSLGEAWHGYGHGEVHTKNCDRKSNQLFRGYNERNPESCPSVVLLVSSFCFGLVSFSIITSGTGYRRLQNLLKYHNIEGHVRGPKI